MAQVVISVGGRDYAVTCRDGEETHLLKLGRLMDERAEEARAAVGGVNEARLLLLAGLLLADEVHSRTAAPEGDAGTAEALERLAERVETLATSLEAAAANT